MSVCRQCGTSNEDGRDFCTSCGEYLRWEPTVHGQAAVPPPTPASPPEPVPSAPVPPQPAVAPPVGPYQPSSTPAEAAAAAPAAQARPTMALLALRLPTQEGFAGGPIQTSVAPGETTSLVAVIRNQSGIVDNYDLSVRGLPEGWWSITPATVYLVPYGAGGGQYEQEVDVRFHPPRRAEAEARPWQVAVVAHSRAYGQDVGETTGTVEVGAFSDIDVAIRPEVGTGRTGARFLIGVRNRGNAPADVDLTGKDQANACRFAITALPDADPRSGISLEDAAAALRQGRRLGLGEGDIEQMGARVMGELAAGQVPGRGLLRRRRAGQRPLSGLRVEPGEVAEAQLVVEPPRNIWIGRRTDLPFQLLAQPRGADTPPLAAAGVFRQRPWLPWWVAIAAPVAVVLAVWLLSQRTERVTVPNLAGADSLITAQGLLQKKGLLLQQSESRPTPDPGRVGHILEQQPPAGGKADRGSTVAVVVGVGDGRRWVPDLRGRSLTQATTMLNDAGLQLLPPSPPPSDPDTYVIGRQLPPPKTPWPEQTPVQVFPKGATTTTVTTTAPPATTTPTVPGAQTSPPVAGGSAEPGAPSGGSLLLPDLIGKSLAQVQATLSRLGLTPEAVSVFDPTVKSGLVIDQTPRGGQAIAASQPVRISLSLGFPDVVYDDGIHLLSVRGSDGGAKRTVLSAAGTLFTAPSLSADGRTLVYQRGTAHDIGPGSRPTEAQIFATDPAHPVRDERPITDGGHIDQRPAVAADNKAIAFISNRLSGAGTAPGNLCLADLGGTEQPGSCLGDPSRVFDRPAWSPDGRTLLALVRVVDPATGTARVELERFTSGTPFAIDSAAWNDSGVLTDGMHTHRAGQAVFFVSFSPVVAADGSQTIAFSANWAGSPNLYTARIDATGAVGRPRRFARVAACEVSWRPDGGELLVVQRPTTVQGSDCSGPGQVMRFDPATGSAHGLTVAGTTNAENPVMTPYGK